MTISFLWSCGIMPWFVISVLSRHVSVLVQFTSISVIFHTPPCQIVIIPVLSSNSIMSCYLLVVIESFSSISVILHHFTLWGRAVVIKGGASGVPLIDIGSDVGCSWVHVILILTVVRSLTAWIALCTVVRIAITIVSIGIGR